MPSKCIELGQLKKIQMEKKRECELKNNLLRQLNGCSTNKKAVVCFINVCKTLEMPNRIRRKIVKTRARKQSGPDTMLVQRYPSVVLKTTKQCTCMHYS